MIFGENRILFIRAVKLKKLWAVLTHSGKTVTVPAGGNYGWRMNQDETIAALNGYLEAGENYTGEVVYYQRAVQYTDPDYGTTYVEVSISDQHFWYYQNGTVVLESDFVSGDPTKGHDTPKGAYQLAYKARDQVLEGQGYSYRSVTGCRLWMASVSMMLPGETGLAGTFIRETDPTAA